MQEELKNKLIEWAVTYNDPLYFSEDPIIFPKHFAELLKKGKAKTQDVEIAAIFTSHLAWGRRAMIVRDCERLMEEMHWQPYNYICNGEFRNEEKSLHRTIKWSEIAQICHRLKNIYEKIESIENFSPEDIRTQIYGQKIDKKAANKKINMMRRWLVRDDGKVDLGIWKNSDKRNLIIPLDVHVYEEATALGLCTRKQKDIVTAIEITDAFKEIFPEDPCLGDFALFGYGVSHQ